MSVELRNASIDGDLEKVKALIAQGVNVNQKFSTDNLNSPLLNASARGNEKVVVLLLDSGADIDSKNKDGESALHVAVRHGFPKVVEVLLNRGLDINTTDNSENTPLHLAASLGKKQMVELLLKLGADKEKENDAGKKPVDVVKFSDAARELLQQ